MAKIIMLIQLECSLTLCPDEASKIGELNVSGRSHILDISELPIRSLTEISIESCGRVNTKMSFMEQDEFIELCHIKGIYPIDENALALMDKDVLYRLHSMVIAISHSITSRAHSNLTWRQLLPANYRVKVINSYVFAVRGKNIYISISYCNMDAVFEISLFKIGLLKRGELTLR